MHVLKECECLLPRIALLHAVKRFVNLSTLLVVVSMLTFLTTVRCASQYVHYTLPNCSLLMMLDTGS